MTTFISGLVVAIVISVATSTMGYDYGLCGIRLYQQLELICDGNFQTLKKRTGLVAADDYTMFPNPSAEAYASEFGQLQPVQVHDIRMRRSQVIQYEQGVVERCCLNPCSYKELSEYCAVA